MRNTQAGSEGFDDTIEDEEVLAGLRSSVAGATLAVGVADVTALGRRTRNRHRAVAAGIGTSAAALVAAIGVLAPSAGTGAGTATNAAGPGQAAVTTSTTSSSGGLVLNIQEAGFSLEEHADGTVLLSLSDAFDPAKLQAAMDRAGIPAAILVRQVPDGWDLRKGGIQCTPDPGVHSAGEVNKVLKTLTPGPSPKLELNKSDIPAGDYITLERFESHGRIVSGNFSIKVGRQTTCVPEHWHMPNVTG